LSCGHYNSEKIGIKYLADKLKEKFNGLDVEFIDIPNEI
jgi:putative NIF3 family GTP cyclohydrolase 1 type 2